MVEEANGEYHLCFSLISKLGTLLLKNIEDFKYRILLFSPQDQYPQLLQMVQEDEISQFPGKSVAFSFRALLIPLLLGFPAKPGSRARRKRERRR